MMSQRWISALMWMVYLYLAGVSAQEATEVSLDMRCFIGNHFHGYLIIYPLHCTCRKTDPGLNGQVQWYFANGTKAPQTVSDSASVLDIEGPILYERTHIFTCSLVSSSGQRRSNVEYPVNFVFGPESAELRRPDDPSNGVIYICPGETVVEKVYCEVPLDTVNPDPEFHVYVDGERYTTVYDALGGRRLEESNVVRLELLIKLNTPKVYEVVCDVWNAYRASINAKTSLSLSVSEKPNCP